jgi:hypothetical protein
MIPDADDAEFDHFPVIFPVHGDLRLMRLH